jgi:hypothetical protein
MGIETAIRDSKSEDFCCLCQEYVIHQVYLIIKLETGFYEKSLCDECRRKLCICGTCRSWREGICSYNHESYESDSTAHCTKDWEQVRPLSIEEVKVLIALSSIPEALDALEELDS